MNVHHCAGSHVTWLDRARATSSTEQHVELHLISTLIITNNHTPIMSASPPPQPTEPVSTDAPSPAPSAPAEDTTNPDTTMTDLTTTTPPPADNPDGANDSTEPSRGLLTSADVSTDPIDAPKKLIKKKKRRPARPQVDPATFKGGEPAPQTGTIFNIWYNKWSGGDREDKYISKAHAEGRCNILRDSGYTKADKIPGSYFCLFFARGLCPHGAECEYLHRLPTVHDMFNPNVDCFGRDKFSDYRDDMGGVGSFMRQNHTLYVGRIHVSDDIEEVVARHFAEWGQVERSKQPPLDTSHSL